MATRLNGVEDISREARRLTDAEMKRYRQEAEARRQAKLEEIGAQLEAARAENSRTGTALRREYDAYVNPYGTQGEQRAEMGFGGSGYGEVLQANAYAQYLTQRGRAAQALREQVRAYNEDISDVNQQAKQDEAAAERDAYQTYYDAMLKEYELAAAERERQRRAALELEERRIEKEERQRQRTIDEEERQYRQWKRELEMREAEEKARSQAKSSSGSRRSSKAAAKKTAADQKKEEREQAAYLERIRRENEAYRRYAQDPQTAYWHI
jgi:hypothetical protein